MRAESLWRDEGFTAWLCGLAWADFLREWPRDPHSLLFPLLARLSSGLFGLDEFGLRLPSALCGAALVPVAGALAARIARDPRAAAWTGWIVALSPTLLHYGQEARAYALAALVCTLALLALERAWPGLGADGPGQPQPHAAALLALTLPLCASAHPFGILFVAALAAFALASAWRGSVPPPAAVRGLALGTAFTALPTLAIASWAQVSRAAWMQAWPLHEIAGVPGYLLVAPPPAALTAFCTLVVIGSALRLPARWRSLTAWLAVACWLGPALAAHVARPFFFFRYALVLAGVAAVAVGISAAGATGTRGRALRAALGLALVGLAFGYQAQRPHREDWREACRRLREAQARGAQAILVASESSVVPFAVFHYSRGAPLEWIRTTGPEGRRTLESLPTGALAVVTDRKGLQALAPALAGRRVTARWVDPRGEATVLHVH